MHICAYVCVCVCVCVTKMYLNCFMTLLLLARMLPLTYMDSSLSRFLLAISLQQCHH